MRKSSLLDSLLPETRQTILAATILNPKRGWYLSDMAHHFHVPSSSLQRELASLVKAGILQSQRDGNRVYYQPDPVCPILPELRGILVKTAEKHHFVITVLNAKKIYLIRKRTGAGRNS